MIRSVLVLSYGEICCLKRPCEEINADQRGYYNENRKCLNCERRCIARTIVGVWTPSAIVATSTVMAFRQNHYEFGSKKKKKNSSRLPDVQHHIE